MTKNIFLILSILFFTACTNSGDVYNKKKHKKSDFSSENTAALIFGTALLGAMINNEYYGGGSPTDYDWDWDYQPVNNRWVCRGIQTGQYAELRNCAYDAKDDNRWPG